MNDADFVLVKRRLHSLIGIDLEAYKGQQIRRRLDGYLTRLSISTAADFNRQMAGDPAALARLRDFLAINVTSFFRDYDKWVDLSERILPLLLAPGRGPLAVWSAACSHGAEAYSLAMLLDSAAPARRAMIRGTDIDLTALGQAQRGGPYTREEVANVPASLMTTYFVQQDNGCFITPRLRSRVQFCEANLLETHEREAYDLIVCRNVLIYFTDAAKQQVIQALARALRPGGILFIGATESITREAGLGLQRIALSFYRRS